MKWLDPGDAKKLLHGYAAEPQAFVMPCDVHDLRGTLPIPPRVYTEEGDFVADK